jgi:uncharacterized membrane protein
MKKHIGRSIGFFRATALGGILYLMPLAVIGALLGYAWGFAEVIYEPLSKWIPTDSAAGIAVLFAGVVAVLVLTAFFAGLIAHRAIGRRVSTLLEKYLNTFIPKYAIYKDLVAGNIGGTFNVPSLIPVMVVSGDESRVAFESDRTTDGRVVVFFPGAPDTWIGHVSVVDASRVSRLNVPFNDVVGYLEQLGRGAGGPLSVPAASDAVSTPMRDGNVPN